MAIKKPLFWSSANELYGAGLKQISDSDLEVISYQVRKAYASLLNGSDDVTGKIKLGFTSGWTEIGYINNNVRKIAYTAASKPDDLLPAPGDDSNINLIGSLKYDYSDSIDNYYYQYKTVPARPDATTHTNNSYLTYDSSTKGLKFLGYPVGTTGEEDVVDTIITDVKYNIRYGDELAAYRVSTSTPSNGNVPGTWTNKGEFFRDSIYNGSDTVYNLYLKTSLDEEPEATNSKVYTYSNGELRLIDTDHNSNLVQNILLIYLLRNYPRYSIVSSNPGEQYNHGKITETYYTQTDSYSVLTSGTYTRVDEPTRGPGYSKLNYYLKVE